MDDHFLTKVEALAASGHAHALDFRAVAARVATDQFLSVDDRSEADAARYTAFMLEALERTDEAAAARVAEVLAPSACAPQAVLAALIDKGPAPAAIVLGRAPDLPHALLLARAESGDVREAAAIAGRSDIDRTIVAVLARRLEPEALRALAANVSIALDRGALLTLSQRGRLDPELGRALLARGDPGVGIEPLFLAADEPTRRRILREAQLQSLAASEGAGAPLEAAREAALAAAFNADRRAFCTTIAAALRVGRADIQTLVEDVGGEPLGLLFAAIGLVAAEAERPILTLRPDLAATLAQPASGARLAMNARAGAARHILGSVLRPPARTAPSGEFPVSGAKTSNGLRSAPAPMERSIKRG